ncbi:MAG: hypothetical protein WB699_19765 [Bacteroidota bacterium]
MNRGVILGGSTLVLLLAFGLLFLIDKRENILNASAPNILGIVEASLMDHFQDPVLQDSLHREFLAIHEKVRTGEADEGQIRKLVVTFYNCYGDGKIDSTEARTLVKKIDLLARH